MKPDKLAARLLAHARGPARDPAPGETRTYNLLDRRAGGPVPVTVVVPAACPVCGKARAESEDMAIVDDATGGEHTISRWLNKCGHHDLHVNVLDEADRYRLEETA